MSLNVFQQTFSLSQASNTVATIDGNQILLQAIMEVQLQNLLKLAGGSWKIVLGPVVYKKDPKDVKSGADNAWFVVKNDSVLFDDGKKYETYLVAVSGVPPRTDSLTVGDGVLTFVDFEAWVSKGITTAPVKAGSIDPKLTYVNYGTASTVYTHLTQPTPATAVSPGVTLHSFISSLKPSDTTRIVFTGHSVGGALTATLSLALFQAGVLSQFKAGNVLVYPTAGPSPGNDHFASLYASKFPKSAGSSYKYWNTNIVNLLDIVPQSWSTDKAAAPKQNILNIPTIYGSPALPDVQKAVDNAVASLNKAGVTYVPLQSSTFAGTLPAVVPPTIEKFFAYVLEKGVLEYIEFIGVPTTLL